MDRNFARKDKKDKPKKERPADLLYASCPGPGPLRNMMMDLLITSGASPAKTGTCLARGRIRHKEKDREESKKNQRVPAIILFNYYFVFVMKHTYDAINIE
jgi:hypothetical protein